MVLTFMRANLRLWGNNIDNYCHHPLLREIISDFVPNRVDLQIIFCFHRIFAGHRCFKEKEFFPYIESFPGFLELFVATTLPEVSYTVPYVTP